jgi:hypothetical protein
LPNEATGFERRAGEPSPSANGPTNPNTAEPCPWRGAWPGACTMDCRLD